MSTFHGPQGKGAMRRHRDIKRAEALERQLTFERDVARVAREQNVLPGTARRVVRSTRRMDRRLAHRRAVRAQGAPSRVVSATLITPDGARVDVSPLHAGTIVATDLVVTQLPAPRDEDA